MTTASSRAAADWAVVASATFRSAQTQGFLCFFLFGQYFLPAQMIERCFGCADIGGKIAITAGLTGLALEALKLGRYLRHNVLKALQIGFSGLQTQFRLMTATMQP